MRTPLRHLNLALVSALGLTAQAQQPYTWMVSGTVAGCYDGQVVTLLVSEYPNGVPLVSQTVTMDAPDCTFSTEIGVPVASASLLISTQCDGMLVTGLDSAGFGSWQDTVWTDFYLACGGSGTLDCHGVLNGPAMPGTICMDIDLGNLIYGTWTSECVCDVLNGYTDCLGIANGPNVPGAPCTTPSGGAGYFGPDCYCFPNNVVYDCLGQANGPAMPNTPCTTFMGTPGLWSLNCECVETQPGCQACFTITSSQPWAIDLTNCSGGALPFTYQWWLPDGNISNQANESWVFTNEGIYGVCLTITDANGCSGTLCDSIYVDDNGGINTNTAWYDCLGIPNGSDIIGTPCQDPFTGIWGIWDVNCFCIADSTNTGLDCLGILNGPNQPGTPCWLWGTNYIGTWDANCACVDSTTTDCEAGFWAMQAYEMDPNNPNGGGAPIPYEIWVWNLSSGTGNITYSWDFGDGSTSVDPYPTHNYSGNGPYLLCLTINDGTGCTDQVCDSISIDEDGILSGMILDEEEADGNGTRQDGFTLNVQNPLTLGMREPSALEHTALWPNPVNEQLNLSFNTATRGSLAIAIIDVEGRVLRTSNEGMTKGTNQFTLEVSDLAPGIYVVRFSSGNDAVNLRFVKR